MSSAYKLSADAAASLTKLAASGATGRGPSCLCKDIMWQRAVDMIESCASAAIITGFFIASADAPETDGPSGSAVLARAISSTGRRAEIWTDARSLSCVRSCAAAIGYDPSSVIDASSMKRARDRADLLIFVERPGVARDGAYYNMSGEDITRWTVPLDDLAQSSGLPVLAIGDGGNEAGMGSLHDELAELMPDYSACLSIVPADLCIPTDISNWGAYAAAAALSAVRGEWLGQTPDEELAIFDAMASSGAVDGVTKRAERSADGVPVELHAEAVSAMMRIALG